MTVENHPAMRHYSGRAGRFPYSIQAYKTGDGTVRFKWILHVAHEIRYNVSGDCATFKDAEVAAIKASKKEP